jgi:hypothetical protein
MARAEIRTKAPKMKGTGKTWDDKEFVGSYDFGENLQDAVAKFGEEVVFTNFRAQSVIRAQAIARSEMEADKSAEEIQSILDAWKPGVQRAREVDPYAAAANAYSKLTPEEQAEFIAALQRGEKYVPKKKEEGENSDTEE